MSVRSVQRFDEVIVKDAVEFILIAPLNIRSLSWGVKKVLLGPDNEVEMPRFTRTRMQQQILKDYVDKYAEIYQGKGRNPMAQSSFFKILREVTEEDNPKHRNKIDFVAGVTKHGRSKDIDRSEGQEVNSNGLHVGESDRNHTSAEDLSKGQTCRATCRSCQKPFVSEKTMKKHICKGLCVGERKDMITCAYKHALELIEAGKVERYAKDVEALFFQGLEEPSTGLTQGDRYSGASGSQDPSRVLEILRKKYDAADDLPTEMEIRHRMVTLHCTWRRYGSAMLSGHRGSQSITL